MTDDSDVCVGGWDSAQVESWTKAAGVEMQDDVGGVGRRKKSATMAAAGEFRAKKRLHAWDGKGARIEKETTAAG